MPFRTPLQPIHQCIAYSQTIYEWSNCQLATQWHRFSFHTCCPCHAEIANHYETLGLSHTASQAEIKKQFYQLSMTYHPDRNRDNKESAAKQFSNISEAYSILGSPSKRDKYDREHMPASQYSSASNTSSSFSSSYAGGRKASGLSRRRGAFRGPPPSFYRSGGWGNQQAKRSARDESKHQSSEAGAEPQQTAGGFADSSTGAWPFQTDPNDVPHFDREGHYRTTSSLEEQLRQGRKKRRRAWEDSKIFPAEGAADAAGSFLMACGIMFVGIGIPYLFMSSRTGTK